MSKEENPATPPPSTAPKPSTPASTAPAPTATRPPAAQATKPAPPISPNLPTERKYIEVKVGDFVEFKVRRPDGEVWKIGRVTSLKRDFSDIMPIDAERIYCTHKEFIRRVLAKDEVTTLPVPTNWYLERH